ncbi:MAG: Bax inhibitor-1/YccA family protein, partial [Bacteroidaceae bacterium]|nr:Bax inhibitor-1/YccA family protein [Bacteroidaceae bacterium]
SLSAAIQKLSFPVAGVLFIVYSILNGVTLSLVFMVYTEASIATTFYIAAGTFAGMALVGSFVKKDLSAIGRILIMALIGLIIATVVNMFLNSSGLDLVISYAGVLIFVGLTAFDAQKIKNLLIQSQNYTEENQMKLALSGSLMLYLDFVNLFLYLLRIFGDRK